MPVSSKTTFTYAAGLALVVGLMLTAGHLLWGWGAHGSREMNQLTALQVIVRDGLNVHTSHAPSPPVQMTYHHYTTLPLELDGRAPAEWALITHFHHPDTPTWIESKIHFYREVPGEPLPIALDGSMVASGARMLPFTLDAATGRQALLVTKGSVSLWDLHDGAMRESTPPHPTQGMVVLDDDGDGERELLVVSDDTPEGFATLAALDRDPTTGEWSMRPPHGAPQEWLPRALDTYLRTGHFERAVWVVPALLREAERHGITLAIATELHDTVVDSFHKETKVEAKAGLLMASSLLPNPHILLGTIGPEDPWMLQFVQWERSVSTGHNTPANRDRIVQQWDLWRHTHVPHPERATYDDGRVLPSSHMESIKPWSAVVQAFYNADDPRWHTLLQQMHQVGYRLWTRDVGRELRRTPDVFTMLITPPIQAEMLTQTLWTLHKDDAQSLQLRRLLGQSPHLLTLLSHPQWSIHDRVAQLALPFVSASAHSETALLDQLDQEDNHN
ncbi:MAG: hypothetical protein AAFX99_34375, partial [Myxococcota bacterium]